MGAGQSTLVGGHVYWMKDIVGDNDNLQQEFDNLPVREQQCAVHFLEMIRNLMLFYSEKIISSPMRSKMMELLREKNMANDGLEWKDVLALLAKNLVDKDPHFLAESVLAVRRDELSPLILWLNFFITMMNYCVDASITFPKHLYYTMFIGQVTSKEINHVQYKYPKT